MNINENEQEYGVKVTYCLCPLCKYIEKHGEPTNRNERRRMEKELKNVLVIP